MKNHPLHLRDALSTLSRTTKRLTDYRAIISAAILSVAASACHASVSIGADPNSPEAKAAAHRAEQKRLKANPYGTLNTNFFDPIDPGPVPIDSPLHGVVRDLPYRYPTTTTTEDASSSQALELARLSIEEFKKNQKLIERRRGRLAKLVQTTTDDEVDVRQIYYDNQVANERLNTKSTDLIEQATKVGKVVALLIKLENEAGEALDAAAPEQEVIQDVTPSIPLIDKASKLAQAHELNFDSYFEIERGLRPQPYECDEVDTDLNTQPSSIKSVEIIRALTQLIKWHQEIAEQRRKAYLTMQAYAAENPKEAEAVLKFDGSKYNDPILKVCKALIYESDNPAEQGMLIQLLEATVAKAETETRIGERLHRCADRYEVYEGIDEEEDKEKLPVATTEETPTDEKTEKSKPKPEVQGGLTYEQKVKVILEKLNGASESTLDSVWEEVVPAGYPRPEVPDKEVIVSTLQHFIEKALNEGNAKAIDTVWNMLK